MALFHVIQRFEVKQDTNTLLFDMLSRGTYTNMYLNDLLLQEGVDYTISNLQVSLTRQLLAADIIKFNSDILTEKVITSSNPRSSQTLFNKIVQAETLQNNVRYKANINVKGKDYSTDFTSKYSPFYLSSASKVLRQDLGELAIKFEDKDINYVVYSSSLEYDNKIVEKKLTNNGTNTITDAMKARWVRYKTCLSLILNVYLGIATTSGSQRKRVGNIEVENQTKMPYLNDMMKKYQESFNQIDNLIFGSVSSTVKPFVKSSINEYPLNARVW